jgi:hypothetical protein
MTAEARQKGSEKNRVVADQFAAKLWPLIRELQANGVVTYRGIARELERRGIRTPRGSNWSGVQVRSLFKRLGQ